MTSEWIRFGFVALFFAVGLVILYISIFGTYRLHFALNRIHSAAMTDTLVFILFVLALVVAEGFSFTSLKFLMALGLQWCTSPLASHMMAKFELFTDDNLYTHCTLIDRSESTEESDAAAGSDKTANPADAKEGPNA